MKSLAAFVGLALLVGVDAFFTGPSSNLYIKNKFIQPDGFNRSYAPLCLFKLNFLIYLRQNRSRWNHPWNNRVSWTTYHRLEGALLNSVLLPIIEAHQLQGSNFRLNVVNQLTDTTMLTSTSIVRVAPL